MERATAHDAANDSADPTEQPPSVRIDGINGIALTLGFSPAKVRRLANRPIDPLPLEHDEGGTFIMSGSLATWRRAQRRSYREACTLGLVPGTQAAS